MDTDDADRVKSCSNAPSPLASAFLHRIPTTSILLRCCGEYRTACGGDGWQLRVECGEGTSALGRVLDAGGRGAYGADGSAGLTLTAHLLRHSKDASDDCRRI
jgi:hypothetical protein